jgi:hypothetical protein
MSGLGKAHDDRRCHLPWSALYDHPSPAVFVLPLGPHLFTGWEDSTPMPVQMSPMSGKLGDQRERIAGIEPALDQLGRLAHNHSAICASGALGDYP